MRDYVDKITNKFLAWKLPQSVCSDTCVTDSSYIYARTGTNLLNFTEARKMVVYLFSELLDEHENLQKFTTQYEEKSQELQSQLTAAQAEIASLKEQLKDELKYRQECLRSANIQVNNLQAALDAAVQGLIKADVDMRCARQTAFESMFRDILHQGTVDILSALDKIKLIRATNDAKYHMELSKVLDENGDR